LTDFRSTDGTVTIDGLTIGPDWILHAAAALAPSSLADGGSQSGVVTSAEHQSTDCTGTIDELSSDDPIDDWRLRIFGPGGV
jgi:hypothetical protein